jgi:hypothetical protein
MALSVRLYFVAARYGLVKLLQVSGIVGLGAGTMAAYAREGDHYTYYEINPQAEVIARKEFRFLSESPGAVEIKSVMEDFCWNRSGISSLMCSPLMHSRVIPSLCIC